MVHLSAVNVLSDAPRVAVIVLAAAALPLVVALARAVVGRALLGVEVRLVLVLVVFAIRASFL